MMNVLLSGLRAWWEYAAPAWCLAAMRRGSPCCTWTEFVRLSADNKARAAPVQARRTAERRVMAQPQRVRRVAARGDPQRPVGHPVAVEQVEHLVSTGSQLRVPCVRAPCDYHGAVI